MRGGITLPAGKLERSCGVERGIFSENQGIPRFPVRLDGPPESNFECGVTFHFPAARAESDDVEGRAGGAYLWNMALWRPG